MDTIECETNLQHPFNLICSAASQGGKTFWVRKLLLQKRIKPWPEKIFWIYCYSSSVCDELRNKIPEIEFLDTIPLNLTDEDFSDIAKPTLIVLDDQMQNLNDNIVSLFTKGTHHLNRSVILTVQNVFYQSSCMRTISLNSHYIVLWKQPRDMAQISVFGNQMYPGRSKMFMEAYKKATSRHYGYLFVDLRPNTDDRLRLRTCTLSETSDGFQRVFNIEGSKMQVFVLVPVERFKRAKRTKAKRKSK